MGLIELVLGRKPAQSDIELRISKRQLDAFEQSIDGQMKQLLRRIAKLEGEYGGRIKELNEQVELLSQENDQYKQQSAEVSDMEAQRSKLMELAPKALAQMGLDEQTKNYCLTMLAEPKNIDMVNQLIEKYFPDTEITLEGLLQLAPLFKVFLASKMPKQQQVEHPPDGQVAGKIF